jgi:gamma-glutamylaminecyclotransferase
LYLVGQRCSPWLVLKEDEGHHVRGQVFMVGDEVLEEMDALERVHAPDGYRRVQLPVVSEAAGEEMLVSAYGKPPEQLEPADIQLGPLQEYELHHAALYQPRTS